MRILCVIFLNKPRIITRLVNAQWKRDQFTQNAYTQSKCKSWTIFTKIYICKYSTTWCPKYPTCVRKTSTKQRKQNKYTNCERRLRGTVLYSKQCSHLHKLTEAYVNFNGKYFREYTFPPIGGKKGTSCQWHWVVSPLTSMASWMNVFPCCKCRSKKSKGWISSM